MQETGRDLRIEIELDASFDPSRLSIGELEHLSAFLIDVVREVMQESQGDTESKE